MDEPLERLLQQAFSIAPHIAKMLVELAWKVTDGESGVLPARLV